MPDTQNYNGISLLLLPFLVALVVVIIIMSATNGHGKELTEVWTADELMGNGAPVESKASMTMGERRKSSFRRSNKDKVEPADWGRPGHLTKDEVDVYVSHD